MTGNRGLTLIEISLTVAIVAILVVALGFTYQGWERRYRIETIVRGLYADLTQARIQAIETRRPYSIDFPSAGQYRLRFDSNGDEVVDTVVPTFPKTFVLTLNSLSRNVTTSTTARVAIGGVSVDFDVKGIVSSAALGISDTVVGWLWIESEEDPDFDCIELTRTKISIGKRNENGTPTDYDDDVCDKN